MGYSKITIMQAFFLMRKASLDFQLQRVTQQFLLLQDLWLLNYISYMLPIQTGHRALNGMFTFSNYRDLT